MVTESRKFMGMVPISWEVFLLHCNKVEDKFGNRTSMPVSLIAWQIHSGDNSFIYLWSQSPHDTWLSQQCSVGDQVDSEGHYVVVGLHPASPHSCVWILGPSCSAGMFGKTVESLPGGALVALEALQLTSASWPRSASWVQMQPINQLSAPVTRPSLPRPSLSTARPSLSIARPSLPTASPSMLW